MLINIFLNIEKATSGFCHINGYRCGLGTLYTFRMVMSYFGYRFGKSNGFFQRTSRKSTSAYTHCGAVAITSVWLGRTGIHPIVERSAISAVPTSALPATAPPRFAASTQSNSDRCKSQHSE